jgi:excisionase family DNA binding protein
MAGSDFQPEPIVAKDQEQSQLAKLEDLLLNLRVNEETSQLPRLVSSTGEEVELPESICRVMRQLVHQLLLGKGVKIATFHQPLTIWEAADLLNVRSQEIEQLLDDGVIPFSQAGMMRRIQFEDLMAYSDQKTQIRRQGTVEQTPTNQ